MANGSEDTISFLEYLSGVELRFLQERLLGLDIYYSGYLGIAVFCLLIVALTVFFLAMFQVIPRRFHVVLLLLGLGGLSLGLGFACAYFNFQALLDGSERVVRTTAGPMPVNRGQEAAVVALPMLLGGFTFGVGVVGCLYLALFWGPGGLAKGDGDEKTPRKKKE